MRVLVIGPCGEAFAELALQANLDVSLYLRNLGKLKLSLRDACRVHVGQLSEEAKLREALREVDAVISFAGPNTTWRAPLNRGTPITDGYRVLFAVMRDLGKRRILILSDPCYQVPEDIVTLQWRMGVIAVRLVGGSGYEDLRGASVLLAEQSDLDWTIFRVPLLADGPLAPVHAGFLGHEHDNLTLSRSSLAHWCLDEILSPSWICNAPKLSNV